MNIYWFLITPMLLSGLVHHLVIVRYNLFPAWAKPIDGGRMLFNRPLFGKNKTYRGFAAVTILNSVFTVLFAWFFPHKNLDVSPIWMGAVVGLGYSLGELPTSFLKRRWGISPSRQAGGLKGWMFYGLEQCDSIIGAVAAANLLFSLTVFQNMILLLTGTGLHVLVDTGLYIYGYKKSLPRPQVIKKLLDQKDLIKQG